MSWIKLHKCILEWEWADDPNTFALWVRMLLMANHEDKEWHGETIRRGEFFTSLAKLSSASGLTVKQVRICLQRLIDSSQIVTERANKGQYIKICKFDIYQDTETSVGQAKGNQTANEGQSNGTQRATTKEYQEDVEDKNNINIHTQFAGAREEKQLFGTYKNVALSEHDFETIRMSFEAQNLDEDFLQRCIEKLSAYMEQENVSYRNCAAAILNWVKVSVLEEDRKTGKSAFQPQIQESKTEKLDAAIEAAKLLLQ